MKLTEDYDVTMKYTYGNQDEGNVLEELNNEMRKRLVIYEQKIKELDPELAKKWGIE